MKGAYDAMAALPGMTISLADLLYESGFYSIEEIASATVDELMQIRGIDAETAAELIEIAQTRMTEARQRALEQAEQEALTEAEAPAPGGEVESETPADDVSELRNDLTPLDDLPATETDQPAEPLESVAADDNTNDLSAPDGDDTAPQPAQAGESPSAPGEPDENL